MGKEIQPGAGRKDVWKARVRRAWKSLTEDRTPPPEPLTSPLGQFPLFHDMRMSSMPDYYSGIGAEMALVGGGRLITGYEIIRTRNGVGAANNYAQMLLDMHSLAPANVVKAIKALADNEWQYTPDIIKGKQGPHPFDMPTDTDAQHVIELYEGLRALGPSGRPDETAMIKEEFIEQLGQAGVQVQVENAIAKIISGPTLLLNTLAVGMLMNTLEKNKERH